MPDEGDGVFFVAGIKGVVSTFDKDLAPLDEAGGEKRGDHADEDFLDEGGVHWSLSGSRSNASENRSVVLGLVLDSSRFDYDYDCEHEHDHEERRLPEAPLFGGHDPEAEREIGKAVGEHAGAKTFRAIGDEVIEGSGGVGSGPIRR